LLNAYKVIKELGFERLAGTGGEKKAIEILIEHIEQLGLKPKLEAFDLVTFDPGEAKINIEGKEFPAVPYGLNENAAIEGEFIYLNNQEVINCNKGAFRGKIVMSYGFSRKLALDLKAGEVAAYIGIGRPGRETNSSSHRQKAYHDGYVPSVNIKHEIGEKLLKFSGKKVKIEIKQKVQKQKANNIVIDIKGKGRDNNLTLVTAHYDSVARCAGSSDNGGGTVTLLKVAEYFSKNQSERDLRIIFFSGEELGLLGSQAYAKKHKKELEKKISFLVNVDVSGDPIGFDCANVIGTKELLGYFDGITKEIGIAFHNKLDIYSSDGMPFSVYEIPSINIARAGGKANFFIHTPEDVPKYVSQKGLENTINSTITLLKRVLNAKVYPIKKEIDESLKEKIEKYLWNLTYEKPELFWTPKYKK